MSQTFLDVGLVWSSNDCCKSLCWNNTAVNIPELQSVVTQFIDTRVRLFLRHHTVKDLHTVTEYQCWRWLQVGLQLFLCSHNVVNSQIKNIFKDSMCWTICIYVNIKSGTKKQKRLTIFVRWHVFYVYSSKQLNWCLVVLISQNTFIFINHVIFTAHTREYQLNSLAYWF